jgi:hypothetical protein
MNEFAAKKKEISHLEAKKDLAVSKPIYVSGLTEGILKESQKVEQHGRVSFEKSVQIELKSIAKSQKKKEAGKKGEKKKPSFGWKLADSDLPDELGESKD